MTTYLILTREFPPQDGGIANVAYEMAKRFSADQKQIRVITWQYPAGRWPQPFDDSKQSFKIRRLPEYKNRRQEILRMLIEAFKAAREQKVNCVYVTSWNFSGVAAALLKLFLGIPYVVLAYGYEIATPALHRSDRWLMRYVFRKAERIFASSRVTCERIRGLVPGLNRLEFMPLGVDARRFQGGFPNRVRERFHLNGKKVLLTVARLFPRKGHCQVIDALPRILEQVPNAFYLIVGQGPERAGLEEQIRSLKLEKSVVFAGYVPNEELPDYYAACDLFILPNYEVTDPKDPWVGDYEGYGIVFAEAAAAGKPAIGGRSGGAFDAIAEGVTGILVDPFSPQEIVQAAVDLLLDEKKAARMGEAGRRRVEEELDWGKILGRYEGSFFGSEKAGVKR